MIQALEIMSNGSAFSSKELREHGIERRVIRRLLNAGEIDKEQRGFYRINPESEYYKEPISNSEGKIDYSFLDEHGYLLEQAGENSHFSFYTALRIHGFSNENYSKIWITYPSNKGQLTFPEHVNVRPFRTRQDSHLFIGIDTIDFNGRSFRVTSLERTLVDMVYYSNMGREGRTKLKDPKVDVETLENFINDFSKHPKMDINKFLSYAREFDVLHRVESSIGLMIQKQLEQKEKEALKNENNDSNLKDMTFLG
jgi:hypothetical protein